MSGRVIAIRSIRPCAPGACRRSAGLGWLRNWEAGGGSWPRGSRIRCGAVALYVELKAKPGKEEAVAAFLANAKGLVDAEPGTISWFAVRLDQSTFAIFDAFDNEAGREAHVSGKVTAALMENAEELLTVAPQIRKADVLADKLPG